MAETKSLRSEKDRKREEETCNSVSRTINQTRIFSIKCSKSCYALIFILILIQNLSWVDAQNTDIRLPPYITVNPQALIVFRAGVEKIRLNCSAGGEPSPTYQWYKNGNYFLSQPTNSGDLIFNTTSVDTEGEYRCYALNTWGKIMSSASQVKAATGSLYQPNQPIGNYVKSAGQALILPCNAPASFPPPTYSWAIADGVLDSSPKKMIMSERVQIDPGTGDLHFSNLQASDQLAAGQCYKCIVFNSVLDASTGGSYATITVNTTLPAANYPPTISFPFLSESPQVGLLGGSIALNCFFNGNPTPSQPTWTKVGGLLPNERCTRSEWNTVLTITNLQLSDAGDYKCEAVNTASGSTTPSSATITLNIQSQPSLSSRPVNFNASNGDTVVFSCITSGTPQPDIIWYRNTVPLFDTLPNKYSLSSNLSSLSIRDVCKTCADGSSDLAVIQCSSGNNHGQVLASGYLNVLDRTTISAGPDSILPPSGTEPFSLPCQATTDPSTPLSIVWYVSGERVYNDSGKWYVDYTGALNVVGSAPQGNYTCVASNGFSAAYSWAWIGATTLQASGASWWIFVLIALIILLICLIGSVIYYMRKNRGEAYHVDEKEQLNGNDPERELRDTGFKEHYRGDVMTGSTNQLLSGGSMMMTSSSTSLTNLKSRWNDEGEEGETTRTAPSGGSIMSSLPPPGSEDGSSLNEYLNNRVGKFDDEGSFLISHIVPIPE